MSAPSSTERVKASARDWFVRIVVEQPSDETRRAFETWRAQDPTHDDAYTRYARVWNDAAGLRDLAATDAEATGGPPLGGLRRPRSWMSRVSLMAASLAVLALVAWQIRLRIPDDFSTAIGETREVLLSDGTAVALGAQSRIQVWLGGSQRRVSLTAGEAFFAVAPDAEKPFFIDIGQQQVRVVGTQFDIRRADEEVRVSVLEGVVRVVSADPATALRTDHILHAGEQLEGDAGSAAVHRVGPIGGADPFAWRKGRLVYVDAPLREVIADANRYSPRRYVIRDEALAGQRVSVAYSVGQVGKMVSGLAQAMPFKFKEISAQQVEIDADDSARR